MQDSVQASPRTQRREPWNKGKLIGAKPPLRSKHVWSIRTKAPGRRQTRDLAMSILPSIANCAVAMLCPQGRGCCPLWIHSRPGDGPAEEDGSTRSGSR